MIVTGKVEKITSRSTKFGDYWDVYVDGRKYGTGKKKPPCSDGDYVTFEAEAKGDFFNADPTTFKKAEAPKNVAPVTAAAGVSAKREWIPEKDRQDSITYQSARKDALQFVEILAATGKLDFGKMKGAEAIDMLETYVDNYTQRFFKDTKDLGHKASPSSSESEEPNDSVEDI